MIVDSAILAGAVAEQSLLCLSSLERERERERVRENENTARSVRNGGASLSP